MRGGGLETGCRCQVWRGKGEEGVEWGVCVGGGGGGVVKLTKKKSTHKKSRATVGTMSCERDSV